MKTIGVFTKNFSLYYDLIKTLKKRKIPYVSLSAINHIPSKIGVVLTSNNELHDIKSQKVIAADAYDTIDHAVDLALQMLIGKDLYSKVFIGVDPGDQPGIAVVGDDILLQKIKGLPLCSRHDSMTIACKRFVRPGLLQLRIMFRVQGNSDR